MMVHFNNRLRLILDFQFIKSGLMEKKLSKISSMGKPRSTIFRKKSIAVTQRIQGDPSLKRSLWEKESRASTNIRFSVHQKRADAEKALKDLLNGKASSRYFQEEVHCHHSKNSRRSKSQEFHLGNGKQSKRWLKKKCFSDENECEPGRIFTANFGGQQNFTWSFNTWENSNYQNCSSRFEWKDEPTSEKYKARVWSESDIEEEQEVNGADQHPNRVALGLPASGPLCLTDVKKAKWPLRSSSSVLPLTTTFAML